MPTKTYAIYTADALKFFNEIKKNNNQIWYQKNKARYQKSISEPSATLVQTLNHDSVFKKLPLHAAPKKALFRLHRDLRFSPGKERYKNSNGLYLSRSGDKKDNGGFYLHLEPKNCFACVGFWHPEPNLLSRLRVRMSENPQQVKVLIKKTLSHGYTLYEDEKLKRAPRGFEHIYDRELLDLLKHKNFVIGKPLNDKDLSSAQLPKILHDFVKKTSAFLKWGWETVDEWRMQGGDTEWQERVKLL